VCVRPRFDRYKGVSETVFGVFHEFTPVVEGLSLDEAFLDVTHSQAALGPAETIGAEIKRRIRERTGLTASVGAAPNKLVAKIASDLRKPDGLVVVRSHEVVALLDPLPVTRLFGIGKKTAPQLERLGVRTLRDLRLASDALLRPVFGAYAAQMRARAAGIDDRPVIADWDEKQISAEETFDVDITDRKQLHAQLAALADRVAARLRHQQKLTECVVVKVRRADFRTYTRQRILRPPTCDTMPIANAAAELLNDWLREQPHAPIRLLGVSARQLTTAPQLELFGAAQSERSGRLDAAVDDIRSRFGAGALARGSSLRPRGR
jgi:DNA polymerase-4